MIEIIEKPSVRSSPEIDAAEAILLNRPQADCPLVHHFGPNVYMREILMRKGLFIIGHQHKTKHFNIILSGRANVMMEGTVKCLSGGDVFISEPGVRKVLFILEDMRWITVHPTDETDMPKLETLLIEKSEEFTQHEINSAAEAMKLDL